MYRLHDWYLDFTTKELISLHDEASSRRLGVLDVDGWESTLTRALVAVS